MSVRVGVAGHRGYSGAELVRLLSHHPDVDLVVLEHRDALPQIPRYIRKSDPPAIPFTAEAVKAESVELVFLATPHEVSMQSAPGLLANGTLVVDLSGAFRLKTSSNYLRWYGDVHTAPELLAGAVYGLPEFRRDAIRSASFVANPGCYPTAANLAIQPLVAAGIPDLSAGIVCDAKSGVSGAGRKASLKTSFCEVTENFSAYAILDHRHVPEVLMNSGLEERDFSFTAQLIPVHRGILETIYFRSSRDLDAAAILDVYKNRYVGECFVRLHENGSFPDLLGVARTNFCDLAVRFEPATGRGVIVSAIDNLGKGAAGQAIQNMNLMLGFAENAGLN